MSWEIIQLNSAADTAKAFEKIEDLGFNDAPMDPYQNLDWLLDGKEFDENLFYYNYKDDSGGSGHCVLRKQLRPIKLSLGEFTLHKYPVFRFELWSTPILCFPSDAKISVILNEFLACFEQHVLTNEALSIEGLASSSPLYQCINGKSNKSLSLQLGDTFMHQAISFPATFDAYLKQMSKRSRKSVQYSQRKLFKDYQSELFECNSSAEIETFLDEAISISKKTYQWNLLSLGLRDRGALKTSLLKWERRAELRCFILRCAGKPVAFMLGYIYQACYYYIDVGYDPDWMKQSVGSVLQMAVIEKLYESQTPPTRFDFSTGYGEHKARFGNYEQEEVNMLLLAPTAKNRVFVGIYIGLNAVSTSLVKILDKIGIKKRLKKMIRRFF
jgi:hypothetical protein